MRLVATRMVPDADRPQVMTSSDSGRTAFTGVRWKREVAFAASASWEEGRPRPDLAARVAELSTKYLFVRSLLCRGLQTHGD